MSVRERGWGKKLADRAGGGQKTGVSARASNVCALYVAAGSQKSTNPEIICVTQTDGSESCEDTGLVGVRFACKYRC